MFNLQKKSFCKICNKEAVITIGEKASDKSSEYRVVCEKGHIFNKFISLKLINVLKGSKVI